MAQPVHTASAVAPVQDDNITLTAIMPSIESIRMFSPFLVFITPLLSIPPLTWLFQLSVFSGVRALLLILEFTHTRVKKNPDPRPRFLVSRYSELPRV